MADPIITLTTDFGEDSPYAAAMKGVILCMNPAARIVDLSHQIPPQDVRQAAFFLAESIPFFPSGAIHVVVVDPGVGSDRGLLYVEIDSHRLLAPDNGCWTLLKGTTQRVVRLMESNYWRSEISSTFHGRDILAPVAAHLSLGVDPALLGPGAEVWEKLEMPALLHSAEGVGGEVVYVDHFGNLVTNIPAALVERQPTLLAVGGQARPGFVWARTYADAKPGQLLALVSSGGFVEVAVAQGSAADRLGARTGAKVILRWEH
jgi:S-adenosylmethionine hydrolase